ncbi:MAG: sugar transferase [Patescibacteria group bacterium]
MKKRIFDLIFSVILVLLASPLFVLIAVLVRLTSKGPVIFRQKRLGFNQAPFTIFKFRGMKDGSGKEGLDMVMPNDDRVTKVGRIIRKTHLDELPQLWNVIKGEMSIIGPRPLMESIVSLRMDTVPNYGNRFLVKPGLTGIVQVRGRLMARKMGAKRNLRLDLFYIKKQNLVFDLKILYRTVLTVLQAKGV